jgi:hypothetical protein
MAEEQIQSEDAFSLFAVATILLNGRWRIARWMLAGGLLAAVGVVNKKAVYSASGSFLPQGFNSPRPSLTGLAGQLAGSITGVSQSMPPDFYVRLLKSRVLLQPIARDTFTVPELGGRRLSFDELFGITGGSQISRDEAAVSKLTGIISVSVVRSTGIIEFGVAAPWRSVALGIANDLVTGVNAYNQRTTQAQAAAEREFVEAQSALASSELQSAESRLERFLQTNRQFESSPELVFERDRLARATR